MDETVQEETTFPVTIESPEFYANQVQFRFGIYDITMLFQLRTGQDPKDVKTVALVRMSPQHALVMATMFVKNMNQYEQQIGKINLPEEHLKQLGLSEE